MVGGRRQQLRESAQLYGVRRLRAGDDRDRAIAGMGSAIREPALLVGRRLLVGGAVRRREGGGGRRGCYGLELTA
jgi:hypothetical protein